VSRLRARDPDLVVAAWLLLLNAFERAVTPEAEGGVLANAVGALAMSAAFLWRTRRPLVFAVALASAATLNSIIATDTNLLFASLAMLIIAGYSLGRHHTGRDRWVPLGLLGAAVGVAEMTLGSGDPQFPWLLLAAGLAAGVLVRRRTSLTRELAERTHELELLRSERERDAVLDERRRIARELHDVVAHTVSVMVVQSGGARRQIDRDPQRALDAIRLVRATGREALAELDRLFGLLHAEDAVPRGLGDLPALAERTRAAGLPVELAVSGTPAALSDDADLAAYRLVQEALTNTLKHGGPGATAAIEVGWAEAAVDVAVTDTGHGAAGPRGEGSRRGLEGMRDRIAAVGGEVEAGPGPEGGFVVRARLPLSARDEAVPA
jgi:signal transduction histidine kinase